MPGANEIPSAFERQLEADGLPPGESGAKRGLVEGAQSAFLRRFGRAPERAWWVPGRIEVFGKHTDYAGGRSLLGAVSRGFVFLAARRSGSAITLLNAASNVEVAIDAATFGLPDGQAASSPAPGFRRYVEVVVRRLARNFPGADLGADLAFASDLPQAAGLSSSSALTVGVATALAALAELPERPEWRAALASREDLAGYLASVENGSSFATLAGSAGAGALTGSEDQTAILACRAGQLSLYSFLPVVHHCDVALPEAWRFVVATSGVFAEKAGNARESYNRAANEVAALLELWTRAHAGAPPPRSLAAALASSPEAASRLRDLLEQSQVGEMGALLRRLDHFLREDARAPEAARAFRAADRGALGELSAASQRDAENLLGNQIPETATLAALARQHGAFAASSFGGGFGGAVWALVEAERAEAFPERWLSAYRERFPRAAGAEVFLAPLGPGLFEISLAQ